MDLGHLIDSRVNPKFADKAAVFESQDDSQVSYSIEKMKRKLDDARAFSKKRRRDLSFEDGKNEVL